MSFDAFKSWNGLSVGYFQSFPTAFGDLGLSWQATPAGPRVQRLWLPGTHWARENPGDAPVILALIAQLQAFLAGEAYTFPLELVALDSCPAFQARVLRVEHAIPRGQVSTYGRIAARLGVPGGARAVGNALARNPFPLLVPCHRAIAANGGLGGFQGGLAMKRRLLEMEGIRFTAGGKVTGATYCYG